MKFRIVATETFEVEYSVEADTRAEAEALCNDSRMKSSKQVDFRIISTSESN